jgi:hypothetical protein
MRKTRRYIFLSQGKVAIVDWDDFDSLACFKWSTHSSGYARRDIKDAKGVKRVVFMHRQVMGAGPGMSVDHRNHVLTDNRKSNLRLCTHRQNMGNQWRKTKSLSGFRGVEYCPRAHSLAKPWVARCGRKPKKTYHATAEEAARAYDKAAKAIYGEFAYQNFPE